MEWLAQNWIWLAVAGIMVFMMVRRGGAGGGCCGSMHAAPRKPAAGDQEPVQQAPDGSDAPAQRP